MSFLNNKVFILLFSLVLLLGCNNEVLNSVKDEDAANVVITIPRVAPYVLESLLSNKVDNRAIVAIDKVVFTIFQDALLIKTIEKTLSDTTTSSSILLAEGTYTLQADIYNLDNSDTVPVIYAFSNQFTVVHGEIVNLSLKGLPNSPTEIIEGYDLIINRTDFVFTEINMDNGSLNMGSEMWFSVDTTSDLSSIVFSEDIEGFNCYVFDNSGTFIDSITKDTLIETVVDGKLYLAFIAINYDLPYYQPADSFSLQVNSIIEVDDGKDTILTATEVSTNGSVNTSAFEKLEDVDYFSFNTISGYDYYIEFRSKIESSNVVVDENDNDIGYLIKGNSHNDGSWTRSGTITANTTGTLYFKLSMNTNEIPGDYTFSISDKGASEIDVYISFDHSYQNGVNLVTKVVKIVEGEIVELVSETITPYDVTNSDVSFTLPALTDRTGYYITSHLEDIDGFVIAIPSEPVSIEKNGTISIDLYNEAPVITEITSTFSQIVVGTTWASGTIELSDDLSINAQGLPIHTSEITTYFTDFPGESELDNSDIYLLFFDNSGTISFTPDVKGSYSIELSVFDGESTTILNKVINVLSETEGVASVTFE